MDPEQDDSKQTSSEPSRNPGTPAGETATPSLPPTSGGRPGLLRTEDTWAIVIGCLLALIGALLYAPVIDDGRRASLEQSALQLKQEVVRAPLRTLAWHDLGDAKAAAMKPGPGLAKDVSAWLPKLHTWSNDPREAFHLGPQAAERKAKERRQALDVARVDRARARAEAEEAEAAAEAQEFQDEALNEAARESIWAYRASAATEKAAARKAKVSSYDLLGPLLAFGAVVALLFAVGMRFLSGKALPFLKAFAGVYLLAILAYALAAQADLKSIGLGYAAWAIVLGLLISNTLGTPAWLRPAVQTEFYIKTGLVLLGVEILLGKVWVIGLPGLFVAWCVTPVVFVATYLFGQRVLKIRSRSLNLVLSADMSVCGVSAAIATAAACRAKKEELTLAVGISMVFTSIMMVVLPQLILSLNMDHVLGGAWIGGTVDATGAVAAAGAFLSDRALYVAATIKMIQNILIGVIAFCVAVFWVTRVEKQEGGPRPSLWEVWRRFPKFVLGFVAMSVLFSAIYSLLGHDLGDAYIQNGVISGWTKSFRGWLFCLAFVSIGLATNFRALGSHLRDGKAVLLYVCGQSLNLVLTLGAAYLMFKVIFADLVERL